ncbi:MAG TPA: trypsin-like peptidase domain-containing protein [Actinophytocola sp.]|uniref:trypsin-like peptidase domain-containing protein n=1 Tax=Actinophytocola sp. TaxID=1872138 RepID=UPI002E01E5F8|nr:trypsin-like peptidase domain-containing protein [Actinophytocola sp.]
MTRRLWARALRGAVLTGAFAGLVLGAGAGQPAVAAPAINAVDFTGIVALSNCSGSVVRTPNAVSTDRALVMSNGHCFRLLNAGEVVQNLSSTRTFSLLNSAGTGTLGTLRADRLLYATMTKTDVSIYRLTITYGQLQSRFPSTRPLTLSTVHPTAAEPIRVVSGFHRTIYSCNIDGFVFQLREDRWTWQDSVRYTPACMTIPGTSGSPVIDANTNQMVAINNTGNEDGQRCTLDNPCEVDQNGTVTVREGINYAQETFYIAPCIGPGSVINLTAAGCGLPR